MVDLHAAQPDDSPLTRALTHAGGELARRYTALWQAIWQQPHVPALVLELCRLRLSQLHGLAHELDMPPVSGAREGLDADTVAIALAGSPERAQLPAGARAAIELTEVYAQDPQQIAGEPTLAVKAHFGEAGFVALIEALGVIDGRIRLGRMLGALLLPENSSG